MPAPPAATDAELLVDRHVDAVHDHVARWTRDATLAASATEEAFAALQDAPPGDVERAGVRAWLLRAARLRTLDELRRATATGTALPDSPVPAVVLAATSPRHPVAPEASAAAHVAATEVWGAAAALGDRAFSVLDLGVRQGLSVEELAAVLDTTTADAEAAAEEALAELRQRVTTADPLGTYASLAPVRAPVPVRTALVRRLGGAAAAAAPASRRVLLGAALLGLLLLVAGVALALREPSPATSARPPTVVAEPVPSPGPTPLPTPTVGLLASPSPEPSPEPTDSPTPATSPTPSPGPTADPTAEPSPTLAITIREPTPGTTTMADRTDAAGREVGTVGVAADVVAPEGTEVAVTWTSDLDPGAVLATGTVGEVELWLTAACEDTLHPLRATVTDEATGATSTAVVEVLAQHTCRAPVAVSVQEPTDGTEVSTTSSEGTTHTAVVPVAATANDSDLAWTWTSDRMPGQVLLEQPEGQVRLVVEGCEPVTHTLTVEARRPADGSSGRATVSVTVRPPPCPE